MIQHPTIFFPKKTKHCGTSFLALGQMPVKIILTYILLRLKYNMDTCKMLTNCQVGIIGKISGKLVHFILYLILDLKLKCPLMCVEGLRLLVECSCTY